MRIRVFVFVVLVAALQLNAFPQDLAENFPNTISGKRAGAFWKVINSADDQLILGFIDENMRPKKGVSVEDRKATLLQLRGILRGTAILKVFSKKHDEISFVAKNSEGEMGKVSLGLDPTDEFRIVTIRLTEATERDLSDKPQKTISETELLKNVELHLADLKEKDLFSGVVLIARKGAPIYKKAIGYASLDYKIRNKPDTKFNIGSIDKTFTQIAIGQLVDEGKLSLEDKLGKFIPDYPNKTARETVTVNHLLSMTSGIGDIFSPEFFKSSKGQYRALKSYLPTFSSKPLQFKPGTKTKYSNGSYILLGIIIEKVSKQSYFDFVKERIFHPIGMQNTYAFETDALVENRATGYTLHSATGKTSRRRTTNALMIPARGSSAGGGYSTAEDLLLFANALESGKLPIPKSILRFDASFRYGLGIAGGAPGLNAVLETKVSDKYTIIVMSNYDPPTAEKVSQTIIGWLR